MRRPAIWCDRCGEHEHEDSVDREKWGRVYAATLSGTDRIGTSEEAADLCGNCLEDLAGFMLELVGLERKPAPAKRGHGRVAKTA